jgi:RNA polymerase sigma-70 factor (ECF subfamily)
LDPDPQTLARLGAGDLAAFAAVYESLGDRVFRICRSLLGQDADAEDATQEVFLKVHAHAAQFAGRSRFSTWVHRIAVHHCYWRLRQRRARNARTTPPPDFAHLAGGPDEIERIDARDLADRLLAGLPEDQRTVVVLREIEGLSYQEIAETLEIPIGTVMSRLNRARHRLEAIAAERTVHDRR